jgi:glyoxylase-like metal-dependent hydrolase (beta-lactamase superfamily II)/ferredoxin
MARPDLSHADNAPGDWYVDERCIDCGTCRDLAPDLFGVSGYQSVVVAQPSPNSRRAWLAAQACPTQSIGTRTRGARPGRLFPDEIAPHEDVFDCGYCSPDSFGATAWFVARPGANLLVDSPRWNAALARAFAARGGIDHVLLTHRDDVADAHRWAEHFGARVWIHEDDRRAAPFATDVLAGDADAWIGPDLVAVACPGHTRGSVVYVLEATYAFTGDSLAWSHDRGDLTAFRGACWHSWPAQMASLARLAADHRFEWVLPGHGARMHRPADEMIDRLRGLVSRSGAAP